MVLRGLVPSGGQTSVQSTTLSLDALGRNVCNTWAEAVENGGPPFTVVVVGSGAYGSYLAAKLVQRHPDARVLVLEAGPFLVTEHVQNLGDLGLNVAAPIHPATDPGVARELVWGLPWRSNTDFPGLAYCCGGKSLYWGGWAPRLTPEDLARWPADASAYLAAHYLEVESETGVVPATDFISSDLLDAVWSQATAVAPLVANLDEALPGGPVQPAPIAVQGDGPSSGLFGFDKYSSLPLLIEAQRDDVARSGGSDAARRLFLVPHAHVVRLHATGGVGHTVEVDVDGVRQFLALDSGAKVVLAASAIESTRLALLSSPSPLMGRNLMAHVRSDFTVRIRRAAFADVAGHVQTAALLVRGQAASGRFHLQLTASTSRAGSDALLYRMIPDLDLLDQQLVNTDPDWITITVRGIGEMIGDRSTTVPNETGSWIDLSPYERDEYGAARAYVHLATAPADEVTWATMDATAVDLLQRIAGSAADIEYLYDGDWQSAPFPLGRPFPPWHWGLGTTYHEAGTLWMGDDPAASVADSRGRLHHLANVYVGDQAAFPTVGSVNPVLTGLTLARRLAETLG
jgi:choline dehydrogenase-like flavoprotein